MEDGVIGPHLEPVIRRVGVGLRLGQGRAPTLFLPTVDLSVLDQR